MGSALNALRNMGKAASARRRTKLRPDEEKRPGEDIACVFAGGVSL